MARTREFEPDQALEKAMQVFWQRGYLDTSMEELVAATGVSRYGLYGVFGSKKGMLQASLWQYAQTMAETFQADLRRPDAGRKEIEGYFACLLEAAKTDLSQNGCLICKTAMEVAPHDADIAGTIDELFEDMAGVFRNAIKNGQNAGEINPRLDADQAARFIMSVKIGVTAMAQAKTPHGNIEAALTTALKIFD